MTAVLKQIVEILKTGFTEIGPAIKREFAKIAQSLFS